MTVLRDLLAIGHLRRADIGIDLVGALQDVDLDVEMKLAHALEDGLARFLVGRERGTTGSSATSLASATPSFSWSAFDFGSIAISITGSGNSIFSRITDFLRVAQRVAGAHLLETRKRDDVAGIGLLDVLAIVRVHQQHAADALLAILGRVDHAGAALEATGIDAAER